MKTAIENTREIFKTIKPQLAYSGKNYYKWKTAARAKLSELLGMDAFTKVSPDLEVEYEEKTEGAKEIRFTYRSEAEYRVPCHMLLPDGVANPPVIICLQGHSTGMHISLGRTKYDGDEQRITSGDRDFCIRAVKEGYAAIALEQRNFGECGGCEGGPMCLESTMTALLMGRTTIGERVWDVSRLIDVLETEFKNVVDVNTICLMGNSGGGTTTAYTAALEDRIVLAMPSCAMCAFGDSIAYARHCSCNYVPNIAKYFDMGDLMAMAAPKYFVQVSGNEDKGFLIEGAKKVYAQGEKAYKDLGVEDKCTLVIGSEGHRFYADDAWPVVHKYIGR